MATADGKNKANRIPQTAQTAQPENVRPPASGFPKTGPVRWQNANSCDSKKGKNSWWGKFSFTTTGVGNHINHSILPAVRFIPVRCPASPVRHVVPLQAVNLPPAIHAFADIFCLDFAWLHHGSDPT
jgi:hypothetical protein